jgi:hypothetical protein
MTQNPNQVFAHLESTGWKRYHDGFSEEPDFYHGKYFDTPTKCLLNNERLGICVTITCYHHQSHRSYQIRLVAQKKNGVWVEFKSYAIGDLPAVLDAEVKSLLAAWEAANNAL